MNPVTIAERIHLFPSRTQKLSSRALRILDGRLSGKASRCRFHFFYIRLHGQAVKTSPFHGGNSSSILDGVTKTRKTASDYLMRFFFYMYI